MPVTDRFGTTSSSGSQPTVTRTVTKSVVPVGQTDLVVDPDVLLTKKHEEWVTNKRVVNHKTKQVETRVQRQLVLEDGRVIADSGPQVTTKTKEDVKVEESENTEHKTTGDDPPGPGYVLVPGSAKVISEKTESNQTVTETREENRQMHDEKIRDLSGEEIHQRTIISPDDPSFGHSLADFPGKLTHYSSRSQKIVDKDEVKEVSELKDGEVTTETTRTHHHEEAYDDEVPEEEAEPGMVPERSAETSRTLQYYTDPREFEEATERLQEESRRSRLLNHGQDGTRAVTYRWVDDHFGGQNGTAPGAIKNENIKTSSGGNRIVIEMSPHRSSPSDFSPRDTLTKSRDSTLKHRSSTPRYVVEMSPSPPYPPSTPVNNNTLGRSTASPFEVYSSSGSSRSKTPVKTFYLGEDNTYQREANNSGSSWKTRTNHFLADAHSSTTSIADSNSLGRSNLSGHYGERSDSFCRIPKSRMADYPPTRYETRQNGAVYSKVNRVKTDKNVQVSLSDEEDDSAPRKHRHRSGSPAKVNGRSSTTMPRIIKVTHETSKSPYSTHSLSNSRHYRSSDSLHSPTGHGGYYEYGTNGHHSSYRNSSSPIYNNSSFHRGSSRNVDDGRRRNDDSHSKHRIHEIKVNKKNSGSHDYSSSNGYGKSLHANGRGTSKSTHDLYNGGRGTSRSSHDLYNGGRGTTTPKSTTPTTYYYASSSPKGKKIPTSPPESGYQSPFPPTPPSSPPPRFGKVLTSDHYGSSSSFSPPESPVHPSTASIRRKAAYPSGSASRSKSSSDLRTDPLFAPDAFSPLSSPLKLKTVGEKTTDPQKVYRVKPGQDGQSVVVQVRDWNAR